MGRRAGVTPEETRAGLLSAAARVFARNGYDGASITAITAEAGLSRGAIYNSFGSKALLFAAVLDQHGERELQELLGRDDVNDVADLVSVIGETIDRRRPADVSLLVEAIVASKRDPELAAVVQRWFTDREDDFRRLIDEGQAAGVVHASVSAETLSRFATMLALGSLLVGALGLPATDHDDWSRLIAWLVDSFRTGQSAGEDRSNNDTKERRNEMAHVFLSDEWFDAVEGLRDEMPEPAAAIKDLKLNIVVAGGPDGDREIHMAAGSFERGLAEGAPTKLTVPYEVAKSMFIDGNQQAGMQAFMSGQIKVEGDMTKLMAMQAAGGPTPEQVVFQEKIKALTA